MHKFIVYLGVRIFLIKCCLHEWINNQGRNALSVLLDEASLQGIKINGSDRAVWIESLSRKFTAKEIVNLAEAMRNKYGVKKMRFIEKVTTRQQMSTRTSLLH